MDLPAPIARACKPLFDDVPLDGAMTCLTGSDPGHNDLVEQILGDPALEGRPDLAAGLWLYVGDLERSHAISQSLTDATGSFWHGIMHRREGDFASSHYWMRRAAEHPLLTGDFRLDPNSLIDAVARAKADEPPLVERQREEWQALFEWCANSS